MNQKCYKILAIHGLKVSQVDLKALTQKLLCVKKLKV